MNDEQVDTNEEIDGMGEILIPENMFERWDKKVLLSEACEFELFTVGQKLIRRAYTIAMNKTHPSSADMTKFLLGKILKSTKEPMERKHPKDAGGGSAGDFPNIYANLIENFNKANNPELIEGECEVDNE